MKAFFHFFTKMSLTLCAIFLAMIGSAQVLISPHPIGGFQFSSKDILNFDVIYSHTENVKVQFDASLQDASGRLVVQYISGTHVLTPGSNSYNPSNYNIAQTRYLNRTIAEIENTTRFLPSGDYTFCINLRCVDQRELCERAIKIEVDYTACADAHAEPVTPLLLSFPEDEAEIENKRPNFTWIPPMPIGNNPNMTYTMTLVKMLIDQTAEDAIRRNRALYTQNGIRNISLMFPNQLSDLEEGEKYAWQVSAHIKEQHIATSDVWEFEIKEEEKVELFYTVKKQIGLESYRHPISEKLGIVFDERYGRSDEVNWSLEIKDEGTQENQVLDYLGDLGKDLGINNLVVTPSDIQNIESDRTYVIKLSNNKGDMYYLRVLFLEPKKP